MKTENKKKRVGKKEGLKPDDVYIPIEIDGEKGYLVAINKRNKREKWKNRK